MKTNKKVIVVLSGGMHQSGDGSWHTNSYDDKGDDYGVDGHRLRILAAKFLFNDDRLNTTIVVSGGGKGPGGQFEKRADAPTLSSVMKMELIELGVPAGAIVEESQSIDTRTQLVAIFKIVNQGDIESVGIISNGWHLPRIEAMIKYCPELGDLKLLFQSGKVRLIDADAILLKRDPNHWRDLIEKVQRSQIFDDRLALEAKGVADIESGRYQFR